MVDYSNLSDQEIEQRIQQLRGEVGSKTKTYPPSQQSSPSPNVSEMSDSDLERRVQELRGELGRTGLERSTADSLIIGTGRGLTDIGQAGRQLFESSPLGGLTDISAEDYRDRVAAERSTYEDTPVGRSTAGKVGRVAGQTLPTLPLGGGATTAARAGRAALQGSIVGGGTAAGGDVEDIAEGAILGGLTGAAGSVGADTAMRGARNLIDRGAVQSQLSRSRQFDDVIDRTSYIDEATGDRVIPREGYEELTTSFIDDILASGKQFRDELAGVRSPRRMSELLDDLTTTDAAGAVVGGTLGGAMGAPLLGAASGVAAARAAPRMARSVSRGARAVSRTARDAPLHGAKLVADKLDDPRLAKYRDVLSDAANRGSTSLAAQIHILSQTDPAFKATMDNIEAEQ